MSFIKDLVMISITIMAMVLCSCGLVSEPESRCDAGIKPEISVNFHFTVRTFYQISGEERQPLNYISMNIEVYKVICEGDRKGEFDFDQSNTGDDNIYGVTPVGYNLHNFYDCVMFKATVYYVEPVEGITFTYYNTGEDVIDYDEAEPFDNSTMEKYIDIVITAERSSE